MKPLSVFRQLVLLGSLTIVLVFANPASSAQLQWDGSLAGASGGGPGIWDADNCANWRDADAVVKWPAVGGTADGAIFTNAGGVVTIAAGGITSNSLTFASTSYQVVGDSLTLNGTAPTITVEAGVIATISSVLTGSAGVVKGGGGDLILSGGNTYSGGTIVAAGTLSLTNPYLAADSAVTIGAGAAMNLVFSGSDAIGTLVLGGRSVPVGSYSASHPIYGSYFAGPGSLIVTGSDYSTWARSCGFTGGPDGHDASAGLTNFEAYAFGVTPNTNGSVKPITTSLDLRVGTFTYARRANALSDLTYAVLTSTDLVCWTKDAGATQVAGPANPSGIESVAVNLTAPLPEGKLFVKVAAGPPNLDPEAAIYQANTGICAVRAQAISDFLTGLDALGIRGDFVDGLTLRADSQRTCGSVAYSLRGLANLAMTGSITRHKNGFIHNNDSSTAPSVPSYCSGTVPTTVGDATMIFATFRPAGSDITHCHTPVFLFKPADGGTPLPAWTINSMWAGEYGANFTGYTYDGLGHFTPIGVPAHAPAEYRYRPIALSNAAVAAAGSLSVRIPNQATISTTGTGSGTYTKLAIGRYSDDGLSAWKNFDDSLVPFVLVFGKVLSDAELAGVYTLIDRYIHPKYRIVTAGDSMSGPDLGLGRYLRDGSGFFGSNLNLCTDLSATDNLPVMVGKLVTTGGGSLNCSLVDSGCPNILVTWFGHHENEVPLCSALDTYNNMKLIWARAKSLGMKVATCTVNPTIDLANDEAAHGTETKRRAINDMMRADVDAGYFDYLLDTESFFINACGLSGLPPANTVTSSALWTFNNATYFDGGHIHLTAAGGQAITDALYARIANAIP